MLVNDLMDKQRLQGLIEQGYINVRNHPTLPLRIFNYSPSAQFDQHWPIEVCLCRCRYRLSSLHGSSNGSGVLQKRSMRIS
jgi:hypothetical protein